MTPLSALPSRMLRRKFFDAETVVSFLGWRPSLLDLETERKKRSL